MPALQGPTWHPILPSAYLIESQLEAPPNVEEFWKLETIGITPPDKIEDNDSVKKHFNETVRKVNGRYQVTLPWRNEDAELPENFELSLGQLKSLYKRIGASPELLQKYNSIIQDQRKFVSYTMLLQKQGKAT